MTKKLLAALIGAAVLAAPLSPTFAQQTEEAADGAKAQLDQLVDDIKSKLKEGKQSEADLAPELKRFDELLAQHKGEKSDEVAQILLMKAMLYVQVLEESEKGMTMLKQLKEQFPETTQGQRVDDMIAGIEKQLESEKIRKALAVGTPFPDFQEKDLEGKPLSVSAYKGKVVLVDFWATWCGPCVRELPNVLDTYKKHHEQGFEIIGISLDRSEDALKKFIKEKEMTWVQYFDGQGWQTKLAGKYGVNSIPATYLLDRKGVIVAKDLRGEALEREVGKLLAEK